MSPGAGSGAGVDPARRLWWEVERVHAVIYFAPEALAALREAGLPGFWRGYFAARLAPLGPVGAEVATAVLFGFHRSMVARAVPDVWNRCPPERVVEARRRGAGAALDRAVASVPGGAAAVAEAAERAEAAVARLDGGGRALAAANLALAPPAPPSPGPGSGSGSGLPAERLWQACTTLREHRGDGHVAAAVAAGLSGLEAHVLQSATAGVPRASLQPHRGWSDVEWEAAEAALVDRGWLDGRGGVRPAGEGAKAEIEEATDRAAARPFAGWSAGLEALIGAVGAVAAAVDAAGVLPYPNPMGLPGARSGERGFGPTSATMRADRGSK